jgi:ABC-2 type transport system permease protein
MSRRPAGPMRKFWAVFRREYLERIQSRWYIFATVAGPVFFGSVITAPQIFTRKAHPSADVSHIVILDATHTDLGTRIAKALQGGPQSDSLPTALRPDVRPVLPAAIRSAQDAATAEVVNHRWIGYLVVDSAAMAGADVYYAGRNASSAQDMNRLTTAVRRSILAQRLEAVGLDPARIRALTDVRSDINADRITDTGRGGSGELSTIFAYLVAFTLYTMIVLYGNVILRAVVDEKSNRVAEVVVASVSPDTLLAGKVFGVSSVAVTQVLLWVVMSGIVYKARGPLLHLFNLEIPAIPFPSITAMSVLALVAFWVLGFLCYAALFAGMGAIVTNQEDATQAALPVTMLVVLAVVLVVPALIDPNSTIARLSSWFPFTAPIIMPVRMSVTQVSTFEVLATLVGVAVACWGSTWIAARLYRVGLLMYGKRPSLRELARWISQAS